MNAGVYPFWSNRVQIEFTVSCEKFAIEPAKFAQ